MLRLLILACFTLTFSMLSISAAARTQSVVISGTATDCDAAGVHPIDSLGVWLFDAAMTHELVDALNEVGNADFASDSGVNRFNDSYETLVHLLAASAALGRDTTNSSGVFSVTIPPRDSVVVLGFAEPEGDTYYFAWQVVGAQANASVTLDLSGGECFPAP